MGTAAAILAAILYGLASTCQAWAANRAQGPAVVMHPAYLTGVVLDTAAWGVSLVALESLPLFVVQSLLASSLALTALLVSLLLKVRLRRRDIGAIVVLVPALGLLASLATEGAATVHAGFTVLLWGATALTALLGLVLYRTRCSWGQAAIGGLGFSGVALGARALESQGRGGDLVSWDTLTWVVGNPLTWAVVVMGLVAVLLYARAMETGSAVAATAILWGTEVVVPAGVGVAVLGDTVRAGTGWEAAACLVLCLAALGVVATSPAQA